MTQRHGRASRTNAEVILVDAKVEHDGAESSVVTLRSGRRVGLATFGDPNGFPVLALHGAPACRLMFDVADASARACGLKLIAFDRPGYGLTPLDYGATLLSRTEAFAELPDALGLDRFMLLGVSGGGPYAVSLAARLGSRVAGLALISPLGPVADTASRDVPNPVHMSIMQRVFFLDMPRHPWVLRANAEIAMRSFRAAPSFFASTFLHLLPEADSVILSREDVSHSMIEMTMEATRHGILGGICDLEIYGEPWHVDYTQITAPARLWQGTADTIVPVGVSLKLGELIPGCEVTQVEGGGHFWIYDAIPEILGTVASMAKH